MDWEYWQRSWDRQQEFYLPEREERFRVMLDVVAGVVGDAPRVLDLACGTGSISRRLFERLPGASSIGVDQDPTLLAIAEGSFAGDRRIGFVSADLEDPHWTEGLPAEPFDALLTATALHWMPTEPLQRLYVDLAKLLRPGGVFINCDHMPDAGIPLLNAADRMIRDGYRERAARSGAMDWDQWWAAAGADPVLAPKVAESFAVFAAHDDGDEHPAHWHTRQLVEAGFLEAGVAWRSINDAMVVAIR